MLTSVLIIPALLAQGASPATDWKATGAEVVALVRDRFFDPERARGWVEANARYAESIPSQREFVDATRRALQQLRASHTSYYTLDDPEYHGLLAIFPGPWRGTGVEEWESIGVDVAPGGFARVVFAGSPAAQAGLKRGDQILGADGAEFHPVRSFRGRAGQPVALTVRSRRDGPTRGLVVVPRKINPRDEWREAQQSGAKVIGVNGKRIAYMPLFSAAGDEPRNLVQDAIDGPFANADALILDLRHGWGGANPDFVNLFNQTPPRLESVGRDGTRSRYDPQWRKPLFILINGGSRSGKEIVAFAVKKHKLGTLVGERTAGAVVSGSLFLLQDRTLLFLAVQDVFVDGEHLEGRGVPPDVEVRDDLPFAEGRDAQLAKALELAGS